MRNEKLGVKTPNSPILPDPVHDDDVQEARVTTSCNEVEHFLSTPRKRKRGDYGTYSPEIRVKMARYAIDNGPAKTARHFPAELGENVNERTGRSIKKLYRNSSSKSDGRRFLHSSCGRPLQLGYHDELVKAYIRKLRVAGAVVNAQMEDAREVLLFKDKTLFKENGELLISLRIGLFLC